jgi:hypothetical protein
MLSFSQTKRSTSDNKKERRKIFVFVSSFSRPRLDKPLKRFFEFQFHPFPLTEGAWGEKGI